MPENIKCVVEECQYNQNKLCHAEAIEVSSSGDKIVETSDGTACSTFKPQQLS